MKNKINAFARNKINISVIAIMFFVLIFACHGASVGRMNIRETINKDGADISGFTKVTAATSRKA